VAQIFDQTNDAMFSAAIVIVTLGALSGACDACSACCGRAAARFAACLTATVAALSMGLTVVCAIATIAIFSGGKLIIARMQGDPGGEAGGADPNDDYFLYIYNNAARTAAPESSCADRAHWLVASLGLAMFGCALTYCIAASYTAAATIRAYRRDVRGATEGATRQPSYPARWARRRELLARAAAIVEEKLRHGTRSPSGGSVISRDEAERRLADRRLLDEHEKDGEAEGSSESDFDVIE
jgi:hypothetical protein